MHAPLYSTCFTELTIPNDPFNVTVVNVTSHNITIRWNNPTSEDSFLIEAVLLQYEGWKWPKKYPIFNSSNEVQILYTYIQLYL